MYNIYGSCCWQLEVADNLQIAAKDSLSTLHSRDKKDWTFVTNAGVCVRMLQCVCHRLGSQGLQVCHYCKSVCERKTVCV